MLLLERLNKRNVLLLCIIFRKTLIDYFLPCLALRFALHSCYDRGLLLVVQTTMRTLKSKVPGASEFAMFSPEPTLKRP